MAYYAGAVTNLTVNVENRYAVVRARSSKDCVQCYISGVLIADARPLDELVRFNLPVLGELDIVSLLAVDADDAETDYFTDAFGVSSAYGNRISLKMYTHSRYLASDRAKFYRGAAGAGNADTLIDDREIFPGGRNCGGWGSQWGSWWGFDDYGPGWGENWGRGEWGFDCLEIRHLTDPLPSGVYPVKVTIEDEAGNESAGDTDTVTLATYPRPAKNLTVQSYDKATDTLVLSFTESEDL